MNTHRSPTNVEYARRTHVQFVTRIRQAVEHVLGSTKVAEEILYECERYERNCQLILDGRSLNGTIIAVVGPSGQGKTWVAQQFVDASALKARDIVPSSDRTDDATEKLQWYGPLQPDDLDPQCEQHWSFAAEDMLALSSDYVVLDTPGATDTRESVAERSTKNAMLLASVHVVVARRDQLRSQTLDELASIGAGSLVLPVISVVRKEDDDLQVDMRNFVDAIRASAPPSHILAPIVVLDYDVAHDATEESVAAKFKSDIRSALTTPLTQVGDSAARCG